MNERNEPITQQLTERSASVTTVLPTAANKNLNASENNQG
jgi:hypothetical protein